VSQGVFEFSIVPAPGAIALLGVAGLSAGRRRR
jgi:xanthosine utilization system XapX-like protein